MNFSIVCGPMAVRNTGITLTSDRLTDKLVATFMLNKPDGSMISGSAIFPQSLVRYQSPGVWQVEELVGPKAVPLLYNGVKIGELTYDAEPIKRKGRLMEAQPASGRGEIYVSEVLPRGVLTSTLPLVLADPFPWYQGGALFGYTVRACVCPGDVAWNQ
jgi:hypothetical protein